MRTVSKEVLLKRADDLRERLDNGKIKGNVQRRRAQKYIANLRWKARQKDLTTIRVKTKRVTPGQGFLPSFLSQVNLVRIEELIADRIFKQIESELAAVSYTKSRISEIMKRIKTA